MALTVASILRPWTYISLSCKCAISIPSLLLNELKLINCVPTKTLFLFSGYLNSTVIPAAGAVSATFNSSQNANSYVLQLSVDISNFSLLVVVASTSKKISQEQGEIALSRKLFGELNAKLELFFTVTTLPSWLSGVTLSTRRCLCKINFHLFPNSSKESFSNREKRKIERVCNPGENTQKVTIDIDTLLSLYRPYLIACSLYIVRE